MLKNFRKGQSPLEYTIFIIIVLAAFLAAGNYLKRGIQGRWRDVADGLGDQYDPRFANGTIQHTLLSNTETRIESVAVGNLTHTTRTDLGNTLELKQGSLTSGAY